MVDSRLIYKNGFIKSESKVDYNLLLSLSSSSPAGKGIQ